MIHKLYEINESFFPFPHGINETKKPVAKWRHLNFQKIISLKFIYLKCNRCTLLNFTISNIRYIKLNTDFYIDRQLSLRHSHLTLKRFFGTAHSAFLFNAFPMLFSLLISFLLRKIHLLGIVMFLKLMSSVVIQKTFVHDCIIV